MGRQKRTDGASGKEAAKTLDFNDFLAAMITKMSEKDTMEQIEKVLVFGLN